MDKVVEEPWWYCGITLSWSFYLTKFYLNEYVWNNGQKKQTMRTSDDPDKKLWK